MGLVTPGHVGSSQSRDRTRVPCIGRRVLNYCTNGGAPYLFLKNNSGLFIYFWLCWVFVAGLAFLWLYRVGATLHCLAQAACCSGFCCRAPAPGYRASVVVACGLSSCGSWELEHRLSSCGQWAELLHSMWDLPGSGIELQSPALVGRFFSTEPPGKAQEAPYLN